MANGAWRDWVNGEISAASSLGGTERWAVTQGGASVYTTPTQLRTFMAATFATGAASSTDNAVARFDGTGGKTVQNSGVIIDDSNNITGVGTLASGNHAITGTLTVTSTSATAATFGPNGTTNPAFNIDCSVASAATGFTLQSKAAGGGLTMTVTSSGTNEGFTIVSKGTGTAGITGGSSVQLSISTGVSIQASTNQISLTNPSRNATANTGLLYTLVASGTGGNSLTGGSEVNAVYLNLSATQTHASTTAITTQRDIRVNPSTHAYQTASGTITDAMGLSIDGAPIAGTNCNITTSHALHIGGRAVGSGVTASYGLTVNPNTGATSNYAAQFLGLTGIGRGTPTAFGDFAASTTSNASARFRAGTAPSSPNEGDWWYDGTNLKFRDSTTTRTITWS